MKRLLTIGLLFFALQSFSQDSELKRTLIEPIIQCKIQNNYNSIYCSSFQIAWNNLCDSIFNGEIILENSTKNLGYLNTNDARNTINNDYLLIKSGLSNPDIIDDINIELKSRFNKTYSLPCEINETDLVTFSFFRKLVNFYSPLNDEFDKNEILRFKNKKVDFFGLKYGWTGTVLKEKLRLHDYISDDDFIIQIVTKDNMDEIYLAKVDPKETLELTYNIVIKRVNLNNISYLEKFDQVRIPYINLNTSKHFKEIEGKRILNENFNTYSFRQAVQLIDFNLNERGISLESIAYADAYEAFTSAQKKLIFDKPFLLIMKQKDNELPYFLMWISNTELMIEL